jgi:hypothetical protein
MSQRKTSLHSKPNSCIIDIILYGICTLCPFRSVNTPQMTNQAKKHPFHGSDGQLNKLLASFHHVIVVNSQQSKQKIKVRTNSFLATSSFLQRMLSCWKMNGSSSSLSSSLTSSSSSSTSLSGFLPFSEPISSAMLCVERRERTCGA